MRGVVAMGRTGAVVGAVVTIVAVCTGADDAGTDGGLVAASLDLFSTCDAVGAAPMPDGCVVEDPSNRKRSPSPPSSPLRSS